MKTIAVVICTASFFGHAVFGLDRQSVKTGAEITGVGSLVAYQMALARADVAIAKSLLNERILKGEVGEAIRDQIVGRYLHQSGQWQNVSPRLGPQGLDHVSVQLNESGTPYRLMVDETKFGSSKLLTTKSGDVQMGKNWVSDRLSGLAKRFDAIRAQGELPSAKVPFGLSTKRVVQVPLSESESVRFWRPAEGSGPWRYDGPSESLPKAVAQLKSLSDLFQAGAEGRIDFPKRVVQVKIDGDVLKVNFLDATAVDTFGGNLAKLPVKANLELPLERTVWASDAIETKIADELHQQMPYMDSAETRRLARDIQSTAKTAEDALAGKSFARFATIQIAEAGAVGVLVAVPIEIAMQFFNGAPVNWSHVAGVGGLAGGSAAFGSLAGNATTYALMQTELGYSASTSAARILGLRSASRFANGAGGVVGGGATAILFAYGGYWLGYYDLQTANRSAVAGLTGTAAATGYVFLSTSSTAAAEGGVIAIEAEAGAGEGPPGWVASGIAIAVTAAVLYGFHVWDEHQDNIRLSKTIEYLSRKETFFNPDTQH